MVVDPFLFGACLILAGCIGYIPGRVLGVQAGKAAREDEIKNLLKLGHEQCLAAFIEGKEQGIRESKPKHGANGRFIA